MASNDKSLDVVDDPEEELLMKMIKDLDIKSQRQKELDANRDRLAVDRLELRSQQTDPLLEIKLVQRITHFWTDADQKYVVSKPLPKLDPNLTENCEEVDFDLESGFDEKALIEDYEPFRQKKWNYFLQTIKDNDFITKYKPQFVAFGGPVGDILATLYDTGIGWKIWAEKRNGVIYLSKTRYDNNKTGYLGKESKVNSYCLLKYLHFITDQKYDQIFESEKCFALNLLELGDNKVMTLCELNAVDDKDRPIEAKLMEQPKNQDFYLKKKLLRFWSKGAALGAHRLVIGTKKSNFLMAVEERPLEDIANQCKNKWSAEKCTDFLNRFFHFLEICVTEDNRVYEFVYNRGEGFVSCDRLHPRVMQTILPETY